MTEYVSWREGVNQRRSSLTLLASEWQTCVLRKQGETPGRGVEEQQAHNEQWAGASCLMGRFIISHYQLIPSDRPGPAAVHQKYVKERERESGGGREAAGWRERDVKRTRVVEGAGAVMWNVGGWRWGDNGKKAKENEEMILYPARCERDTVYGAWGVKNERMTKWGMRCKW